MTGIIRGIRFALSRQYVLVNGIPHLNPVVGQGLACASELADLTAARRIDDNFMASEASQHVCAYFRFRDDQLIVKRRYGEPAVNLRSREDIHRALNACCSAYKITTKFGNIQEYLDLKVKVVNEGGIWKLSHAVHFKESNQFCYLPMSSSHSRRIFTAWVHAELKRYAVNCMEASDFEEAKQLFGSRLRRCRYDMTAMAKIFADVKHESRQDLLAAKPARSRLERTIACVVPHHAVWDISGVTKSLKKLDSEIENIAKCNTPARLVMARKMTIKSIMFEHRRVGRAGGFLFNGH